MDIFIGRQPIFDHNLNVYAYELLFRSHGNEDTADVTDGDRATSQVMLNTFADIGLDKLVGKHRAFINLTQFFLENPERVVIPPGQVVLEVLEDVKPDKQVIKTLTTLKAQGHTIALDDFIYSENLQPLVSLADIIKIDILALSRSEIRDHVAQFREKNIKLLAEKVETYDEFEFLKTLEFDYYQGYFFAKPTVIKGKGLESNQVSALRLVNKLSDPDLDVAELSAIIRTDVALSHKILKFINSPASGLRTKIDSIQRAVVFLGLSTIKNLASLIALTSSSRKPNELIKLALVRARTCEQLARKSGRPKPESYFTIGLFSTLDAMLDLPFEKILKELPLSEELKLALLERQGHLGSALNCVHAMEGNDFSRITFVGLTLPEISELYLDSTFWADQQVKSI
ncbi:MAG: EAL and modified HD-GYP domain-containing signal transduction protein [Halioglobus sp.]